MKTLFWTGLIVIVIAISPVGLLSQADAILGFPLLVGSHNAIISLVGGSGNMLGGLSQGINPNQFGGGQRAGQRSGGYSQHNIPQLSAPQGGGGRLPVFIKATHAIPGYTGWAYAFCTKESHCLTNPQKYSIEMGALARAPAGYQRGFMVSSYNDLVTAFNKYGNDFELYGVTWIGYDAEKSVGTTQKELDSAYVANGNNDVAKAANLARSKGYGFIYGTNRREMDDFIVNGQPSPAVTYLVQNGLTGIALQDQKPIFTESAEQRYSAAMYTINAFRSIKPDLHVTIQLMDGVGRCGATTGKCAKYVRYFSTIPNVSLGIWPTGSDMSKFVRAINP